MAPIDKTSDPAKGQITLKTPFSIAARSTTSSKPAKHARNVSQSPVIQPKSSQQQPVTQVYLDTTSTRATERIDIADVIDEGGNLSRDSTPLSSLRTPGPGSSVSQVPRTSSKRSRARTSRIYQYITIRGENFVCNSCSRSYKSSGGTGAIARHLKNSHSIDATASVPAEKRTRERTAIDAAILRGAEMSIKAEEKRREDMMGIGLDKNTLEYLYLKWTLSSDIPLNHVRDTAFRTFLEYVNPVANRMLPNSESTMKIHAGSLLGDEKEGLADNDGRIATRLARGNQPTS